MAIDAQEFGMTDEELTGEPVVPTTPQQEFANPQLRSMYNRQRPGAAASLPRYMPPAPPQRQVSNIERKLTLARYYQDVLESGIFTDLNDSYARIVESEIMGFIQERLEVMLGERSERTGGDEFTDEEKLALRALARKVLTKEQPEERPEPEPPKRRVISQPHREEQPPSPPPPPQEPERPSVVRRPSPLVRRAPPPPPRPVQSEPPPPPPQPTPPAARPVVQQPPTQPARRRGGRRKAAAPQEQVGLSAEQLPKPIPQPVGNDRYVAEMKHAVEAVADPKINVSYSEKRMTPA